MTVFLLLAGLTVAGLIVYLVTKSSRPQDTPEAYFVAAYSESQERIRELGLNTPSEDASAMLDTGRLAIPKLAPHPEPSNFQADPERDWVIELVRTDNGLLSGKELLDVFDYEWRSQFPSTVYGFIPTEQRWTYALGGDSPTTYSKLQIAVDVQHVFQEKNPDYNAEKLLRYTKELTTRIKKFAMSVHITQAESTESATQKAKILIDTFNEFNYDAVIALYDEKPFDGLAMWDALQSAGLNWGDGDLFHWSNAHDYGHEQHFSVWTTTAPGYFLPESIRARQLDPADLIFSFSVPRSADPENVYDVMLDCARYCQRRLGGVLFDREGNILDEEKEKQAIGNLVSKMTEQGLAPGSSRALRLF